MGPLRCQLHTNLSIVHPKAPDVAEPSPAPATADRRPTSHQVVAEIMRHRIALGDFPPGSRLPTERELAEVLGVGGNPVLHQAVERARADMFVGGNALWLQAGWSLGHAGSPAPPEPRLRDEHLPIALAILGGDGPAAEARMREHLDDSLRQFRFLID